LQSFKFLIRVLKLKVPVKNEFYQLVKTTSIHFNTINLYQNHFFEYFNFSDCVIGFAENGGIDFWVELEVD